MQPRPSLFPLLAVDLTIEQCFVIVNSSMACRRRTLIGYSMCKMWKVLARVVVEAPWTSRPSSTNIRYDLHWLPVSHRITYKLCLITWKALHTTRHPYLSELMAQYFPFRSLHSSNTNLLARLSGIANNFSSWAFSISAPVTWNSVPVHIHSINAVSTFKRQLKSFLFQSTFVI